jgi:pimeloyl-ACP methyl ester carboxylesterase
LTAPGRYGFLSAVVPEVRFFRDRGGHRIAYAEQGQGALLVLPAWWVSHLERDADNPTYRRFFDALAAHFRVVRYDRLGVGLSDRVPRPFTLHMELEHLEALVDHLAADRVHLFGLSCGGPTAVAFAAQHPARVAKMVLYGSYLEGRKLAPDKVKQALVALVRAHWGLGSRALTDIFYPGADTAVQRAFKTLQREASDAETAARLLELTYALDASPFVEHVAASVLVLHRKDDRAIAYPQGRELAARLSGARFVTLDGSVHMPWEGDAQAIVDAVVAFAGEGQRKEASRGHAAETLLRRDGDVWTLRFGGRQVLLKDAKGIGDLARLLLRPGEAVHVLEILGGAHPQGAARAEPSLDRKALASYRTRLADIEEALGDAATGPRRAGLEKEREALLRQLAVDTGLGGRSRKLNDPVERARKAVAARIRDAIRRIAKVHPEVGAHLDRSVATGLCCVYRPRDATRWEVSLDAI